MQRHIDRSMVDGALLHVVNETGEMRKLAPVKAHPMVLQGDGYFVLCAELRDKDGTEIDVDYYLTASSRGYKVFRVEIDNRGFLKDLMDAGRVSTF